jgi:DnaJ-class molecular chaperone
MTIQDRGASARARYAAQDRCGCCGGKPLVTKTLCQRCKGLGRESARRQRERKIAAGTCIDCPSLATNETLRCAKCAERCRGRSARARAERVKRGL